MNTGDPPGRRDFGSGDPNARLDEAGGPSLNRKPARATPNHEPSGLGRARVRGVIRIRVERQGERSVLVACDGQVPLAPRPVGSHGGPVRIALVQTVAGLLSGDEVEVEITVGAGASLELSSSAALLAYPAQHPASFDVSCEVGADGRLAWLPQATVLAAGCDFRASMQLELGPGAAAVLRETFVLGRHGEPSGRCDTILICNLAGTPLLRDRVLIDERCRSSWVGLDGAAVYSSLALLGARPARDPGPEEFELAGNGRLLRLLAEDAAEAERRRRPVEARYLAELQPPQTARRLTVFPPRSERESGVPTPSRTP